MDGFEIGKGNAPRPLGLVFSNIGDGFLLPKKKGSPGFIPPGVSWSEHEGNTRRPHEKEQKKLQSQKKKSRAPEKQDFLQKKIFAPTDKNHYKVGEHPP